MNFAEPRSDVPSPNTEKRRAQRRRVLKDGTIAFGGLGIPCTVRDISDSGAALIVSAESDIPKEFVLAVVSSSLIRKCRMVWRQGSRLGAVFSWD
jgi:hypothetical protein